MCVRYEEQIENLNSKILNLEAKGMKGELIIFGISEIEGQTCAETFRNFMKEKLEIAVLPPVNFAYWKGTSKNKPMVVKFTDPQGKAKVYANIAKLKGKTNTAGKPYRIEDHLPEEMAEAQRRKKAILVSNKKSVTSKLEMNLKKGELYINSSKYIKKVQCPKVKEILNMTEQDALDIQELEIFGGVGETEDGSVFNAFVCKVSTYSDVRRAYQHFKRCYADASHISMAYKLDGTHKAYDADFINNSEHGLGRRLLQIITSREITSVAAFMIRYFGGIHIGPKCFQITQNLVEQALEDLTKGNSHISKFPMAAPPSVKKKSRSRGAKPPIRGAHAHGGKACRGAFAPAQLSSSSVMMPDQFPPIPITAS